MATLGVFDGVHRGHQEVLGRAVAEARTRGGPAAVVTFGRHPRAVIEGRAPQLLTALRHKLRILEGLGIDVVLLLHFDRRLQSMEAETFARSVFADALGARHVILGYNNRFGRGGAGDVTLLERLGAELGFTAEQVGEVRVDGRPVSSTRIREAILAGELQAAAHLLGRPFSVMGRVVRGDHLGGRLGFPTANLNLHHEVRPPRGVYGCRVRIGEREACGIANIGIRPTVGAKITGAPETWEARDRFERVEVHVLDFDEDLYGRSVELVFLTRLREEKRFPSLDALKAAIAADERAFRTWLARHPDPVDTLMGPT